MGQDGETFSLTQGFRDKADNPDLLRTTETARDNEQQTFLMGMGDGLVLQNSGRIALSNASDKAVIEAERKERDKQAYQRALELVSQRLNDIQTEIEVSAKLALGDGLFEIAVRRSDHSDIDGNFFRSADR